MSIGLRGDVKKRNVTSRDKRMSKERLMQWIALAANGGTIIGLLMVIMQLQQNRTLMRAQVRHELATTIVELLNSSASNGQLAGVVRRAGLGEQLTEDEHSSSGFVLMLCCATGKTCTTNIAWACMTR
jgi:hypothetical protein